MADKGHQGYANTDEERQRQNANEGGHVSHEKGAAHEFNNREAADADRRGSQVHTAVHASRESAGGDQRGEATPNSGGESSEAEQSASGAESSSRDRRTRGGTHDQHVTAGKKGGSRIRELIELGYKYEQEHGIGPGQNERSKLAAKRRSPKTDEEGTDAGD